MKDSYKEVIVEEKRRWKGWRKALPAGVAVIVVLLVLMGIGLAVRHGRGTTTTEVSQGVDEAKNAADAFRTESLAGETEKTSVAQEQPQAPEVAQGMTGARTQAASVPPVEVKTIKTGVLTLEIKKGTFNQEYSRVVLIAESSGGYVSDSRSNSDGSSITGGTMTIRVPNESYSRVLEDLKKLGKVTAINEESQDVTEEYVDMESRINNLRAQEAVYLRLMAKAQTIDESIAVQRELSVIQEQIEQLTGRRNYLDNHVQFSSVQVNLFEAGSGTGGGEGWGFTQALSDAAHGVVDGFNAVIRFFGDALVYIIIIAFAALLAMFIVRARRRGKPATDDEPTGV